MSSNGDALHGQVLGGRYQLGRRIGAGGDTVVYEATDLQLERQVAIKIVTASGAEAPDFHRRFRELAERLTAMSHPNILTVHDWGQDIIGRRDLPYLVSEYVTGGSLADMIDRGRYLTPSQALIVALDACRGLDHAHRHGLVHGFLRPSRLMFGSDRRVRIADLGLDVLIAKVSDRSANDLDLASARYLAPEQIKEIVGGPKADVYSLALSIVEAVTGAVPFGGDTAVATLANRVDKLLPVSADLGPLAAVLEKAGRARAAERSTAGEFGRGLVQIARNLPKPAPLPLAGGVTSMFEAPAGQETTSELTRFRDSTGALLRDPTAADGWTRPGPADASEPVARPVDQSGGIPRPRVVTVDETGGATGEAVRRPRGTVLAYLALVVGLVAASALAVVALRKLTENTYEVPSLIGLDIGQARNEIATNGWEIVVRNETTDTQPQDKVFKTDPPAGASLSEGEQFVLYVSAGPPLASLPEVVRQTVDVATAALQQAKLTLVIGEQRYDEDIPAGEIISWQVTAQPTLVAGDQVTQGTTVSVVVSMGPQPRTVPDLIGLTITDAQAVVGPLALGVKEVGEPVFSLDIPAGAIASQSLPADQDVPRGTTVEVTLSKGPDLRTVPNVIMSTLADATTLLNGAGFAVGEIEGDGLNGLVVGMSYQNRQLTVGEQLPVDTAIDLVML